MRSTSALSAAFGRPVASAAVTSASVSETHWAARRGLPAPAHSPRSSGSRATDAAWPQASLKYCSRGGFANLGLNNGINTRRHVPLPGAGGRRALAGRGPAERGERGPGQRGAAGRVPLGPARHLLKGATCRHGRR